MASKKKKVVPTGIRINMGGAKTSDEDRMKRSGIVGTSAKTSPLYSNDPIMKMMADALEQAGIELQQRTKDVTDTEQAAATARTERDEARVRWNRCWTAYVAHAETRCKTESDVKGLGLRAASRAASGLVIPSDLIASFDPVSRRIRAWAKFAGGRAARCVFEISPDPITPTSFTRLEGHAAKRWLDNPGRGMWWIRVAMMTANDRSEWVGPVSVIIP